MYLPKQSISRKYTLLKQLRYFSKFFFFRQTSGQKRAESQRRYEAFRIKSTQTTKADHDYIYALVHICTMHMDGNEKDGLV